MKGVIIFFSLLFGSFGSLPISAASFSFGTCSFRLAAVSQQLAHRATELPSNTLGVVHLYNDSYVLLTPWGILTSIKPAIGKGPVEFYAGLRGSFGWGMNPLITIHHFQPTSAHAEIIHRAIEQRNLSLVSQVFPDGFGSAIASDSEDSPISRIVSYGRATKLALAASVGTLVLGGYFFIPTTLSRNFLGQPDTFYSLRSRAADARIWRGSVMVNYSILYQASKAERPIGYYSNHTAWYGEVVENEDLQDLVLQRSVALDEYFSKDENWSDVLTFLLNSQIEPDRQNRFVLTSADELTRKFWKNESALPPGSTLSLGFLRELIRTQIYKSSSSQQILRSLYTAPPLKVTPPDASTQPIYWKDILNLSEIENQIVMPKY